VADPERKSLEFDSNQIGVKGWGLRGEISQYSDLA